MMKATKAGATCDGAARPGPRPYKFSNELCRRSSPGLGPSGEARHDSGGPDGAPTGEPGHDMAPDSGGGGWAGAARRAAPAAVHLATVLVRMWKSTGLER